MCSIKHCHAANVKEAVNVYRMAKMKFFGGAQKHGLLFHFGVGMGAMQAAAHAQDFTSVTGSLTRRKDPHVHHADLLKQRMKMLHEVALQAKAIAGMQPTDRACLLQQHYLEVFRLQEQHRQGPGRPQVFPEQGICFAFEEGGMVFGLNRPGVPRSGIPLWTG